MEVLKQQQNNPVEVEKQVCILYAAVFNMLKELPLSDIGRFTEGFYGYLERSHGGLLKDIRQNLWEEQQEKTLRQAIGEYLAEF